MRKKKFTKERFYKRLAARKLKAMLRIEQGIKLAKEVINTEHGLNQAIQNLDMDLAVQLTIKQMNLHNQVKLLMAYRV
ncbi:hypothetical protein [Acinetobacter sp. UNC436CL71CviS28]|uniref:Uncharacterized protein n=1 Tax=uncultured Caudovirales phage TaxID=2100421 RepID=A0A2H4J338_9CAUD|nr:hypothetical protein [Acinetobacter sp. UNC436CL71CviS28]ASN69554.1 hypothetical protein 2F2_35 [uncultured Caudovirales phage]